MAYSLDLKTRIVNYVENGGSVTKAVRIFQVGRASIYRWLDSRTLAKIFCDIIEGYFRLNFCWVK